MFITFLPMNRIIQVEAGSNLFQVARDNEIDLGGICSGNKTCGKCKAIITEGNTKEFEEEELRHFTEEERSTGMRLTCCFLVVQDTCVIVPNSNLDKPRLNSMKQKELNISQYGVAFDIGTTSVEAELWNLEMKESIGKLSEQNPQTLYGADVISRISYANSDPTHLDRLTKIIRECCNKLILELTERFNISTSDIVSVVIAANTTMSHLFLGKSVVTLSKLPFQGISYEGEEWKASDIGMNIQPDGSVYIMPGIGGHVGSDTVGCILAKNLAHSTGNQLLVDIGTNGEIVLAKDGKLIACSAAAGPAFEGAAIHQGMRAVEGAISKVEINKEEITLEIIGAEKGNVVPIGICGSGVLETVSELYRNGIMNETGRLLGTAGEKNYVTLWQESEREVILTQKDIRELQLAKSAIYAGIVLLLKEEKITIEELDHIYLAGAFGCNINLNKAIHIGLLPDIELERIDYIGNGSLEGAAKLLIGEISKQEAEQISKDTRHIELALCEDFLDEYVQAISFPIK